MTGLEEIARHRQPHVAEPDETDPRHAPSPYPYCVFGFIAAALADSTAKGQIGNDHQRLVQHNNEQAVVNLRKERLDDDHRDRGGEPDHRPPRRGKPQTDGGNEINDSEKYRWRSARQSGCHCLVLPALVTKAKPHTCAQ